MGYINEKKLTKHVYQPGKSSLQMGNLSGFWLLSTSLIILSFRYRYMKIPLSPTVGVMMSRDRRHRTSTAGVDWCMLAVQCFSATHQCCAYIYITNLHHSLFVLEYCKESI